jgi:PAS domain S-box-containing protein
VKLMFDFLKKMFAGSQKLANDRGSKAQPTAHPGLRESEEQFAKLVSGVRDYGVFILDHEGNILTWNSGAEQLKGYRADEIIGQHFSRFYPNEAVSSGWPAHELEVATLTGRFEDEGWRVRKDGSMFWASVVITALREESGEVRGFLKITRDLTDRKQAEEKLRLSEERFRLIAEGATEYALFMLDPEGYVATWNAGAQRLKGYTASEIIGQHFSRFYPQEAIDRGWPAEELRRAMTEGRFEDEGWRIRQDGSRFWANVVISVLRDKSGVLRGFAKLTRDLTERKQNEETVHRLFQEEAARKAAEEAAHEIERHREQLQVTLASIGDAVIVADEQGRVTFLNPVAEVLTGWQAEEAQGKPLEEVFQIINEQSRQLVENPISRVFREKRIVELANHTALIGKQGREVPVEDSAAPIRHKDGSIVGAVLVFRDVTESRRAMQDRLYLAAIVDSSDDAIIGQTLEGRIASWNKGAERLYGYSAAEVADKPLSMLVPSELYNELPAIVERINRDETIEHYETQRVRRDGGRIDVSLTISPVRNSAGEMIGSSIIARDISVQKEAIRRMNEFLALLAHELRNPLAPLRNGLEVIRLAGDDRETIDNARTLMERQLQHMVRLVDDLLDVSRISQGKLQLHKERVSLSDLVAHALEVCDRVAGDNGHDLIVEMPRESLYVDVDKTRLAQALCNLLNNAAKYSERGSKIWLTVERHGNEGTIGVKDCGIGISAESLTKVFELFMQEHRSLEKSRGGLGVGLSIVKRLIEMHDGRIQARSEGIGKGSEFVIHLPLVTSPDLQQVVTDESERPAATIGHRILVVDDNEDAATSLATMLKLLGHETRVAHDGESGFELVASFLPDLAFLDLGMPKLNGYDMAKQIRQELWGKKIVLVALTGWGQEEDRRRSEAAGFDVHLVKPIQLESLEKLLANLEVPRE